MCPCAHPTRQVLAAPLLCSKHRSGILSKVMPSAHLGPVRPLPGELRMCPICHGWGQV